MSTLGWTSAKWLKHVTRGDCKTGKRLEPPRGVTRWYSGDVKPARKGWYERIFTDGIYRQHWNGQKWSMQKGGFPHWRQVGDYPAWRGLTEKVFIRGSVK